MTFNEMVLELKAGKKTRRPSNQYANGAYVVYADGQGMLVQPNGYKELYLPSGEDMEATDWEVIVNEPMTYTKKPTNVEAFRYVDPSAVDEICGFVGRKHTVLIEPGTSTIKIPTNNGVIIVNIGDYIIKDEGEIHVSKSYIFKKLYDLIKEEEEVTQ